MWKIEFEKNAAKELSKLDKKVSQNIIKFLGRVEKLEDPRSIGQALKGTTLGAFWKYRLGDYRIICEISDKKIVIVVVKIGHRKNVYK